MLRSMAMMVEGSLRAAPVPAGALPAILHAPERGLFAVAHTVSETETSALVPHANNIVILGWIDAIASLHGAAAGASRPELAASGRMWFVARHEIDYLGEAFTGDRLVVATWVEKLGRTSLVRATRILRENGELLTRASSRWALVDLATRRPTAIPDAVRGALAGEPR
ncbi:MAG: acyl-CoA thioesterase [bacterium]|jgi:acyl-CoA thioester hydrolase